MFQIVKKLISESNSENPESETSGRIHVKVKDEANSNFAGHIGEVLKYDPDGYVLLKLKTRLRGHVNGIFHLVELDVPEEVLDKIKNLKTGKWEV